MRFDAPLLRRDLLRRFDPRARLAAALSLLVIVSRLENRAALALLAAACALALLRDLPRLARRLLPLEAFCLLFLPQIVFGLMDIRAAALFVLRLHAAAFVLLLFIAPLGARGTAEALALLRVSPKLLSIFYLSLRCLDLMRGSVTGALEAARLRRNPALTRTFALWRVYGAVFAASLAAAAARADATQAALSSRGFAGIIPLTRAGGWSRRDTALILAAALAPFIAYETSVRF